MSVSVAQMITDIGYAVDDPNQARWGQTQLLTYINEAQRDISRRAEILESISSMPVNINQRDYIAPNDTVRIYRVEFMQTLGNQVWPVEHVGMNEMDAIWGVWQFNQSAWPSLFTTFLQPPNLLIRMYPVPGVGGRLNLYYYRLSRDILATDNIDLPSGWEDLVRDYCEFLCKRSDHDQDAIAAKQIYEQKLNEMIDKTRRYVDQPGRMTTGFDPYPWFSFGEMS